MLYTSLCRHYHEKYTWVSKGMLTSNQIWIRNQRCCSARAVHLTSWFVAFELFSIHFACVVVVLSRPSLPIDVTNFSSMLVTRELDAVAQKACGGSVAFSNKLLRHFVQLLIGMIGINQRMHTCVIIALWDIVVNCINVNTQEHKPLTKSTKLLTNIRI